MSVKISNLKKIGVATLFLGAIFASLTWQARAEDQSDAIAVRVMPNPNHDSIEDWYVKQGYKGAPQSLMVDGYEAIRDGRTVFVNAANLDTINNKLYTNIYLISFNQESAEKTVDILGQLISHWKFNSNATVPGQCSISKQNCQADTDCPKDYICSNSPAKANQGKCVLKEDKVCLIDSDCPINLFCDSLKAKATRDVKRLGELNNIRVAVESFKAANGKYPSLQSGTYVLGNSLSVWPSWQETLASQLKSSQLSVDPINTLGFCSGFDAVTCWNKNKNEFVDPNLILPYGSLAIIYTSPDNGSSYDLCSVFESKRSGYDTAEGQFTADSCAVGSGYGNAAANNAPVLVNSYLDGEAGQGFNGYIKAKDNEGDAISWKIDPITAASSWTGWSSLPSLKEAGDNAQKNLYALKAGVAGIYKMLLTLTDSRGAIKTYELNLNISNASKPRIEAGDVDYFVDPVNRLNYTFFIQGNNATPSYTFKPVNSEDNKSINSDIAKASITSTAVGLNRLKIDISALISTSSPVTKDITIPYRITATANGVSASKDININLKMERPYLDLQCENMARLGQAYQIGSRSCLIGTTKSGNHSFFYSLSQGPAGLGIHYDSGNVYLAADNIFPATKLGMNPIKIKVTNEYGAYVEGGFDLKVNSFCGDGIKQKPNTEGRGGLYNNGVEECDGFDGVWTSTTTMSMTPDKQYACVSGPGVATPYPIMDNNSCVFKRADQGGGYCGDGLCQNKVLDAEGAIVDMENCSNCSQDCGICLCTPQCDDRLCGDDGCGGTCGDCSNGETCVANSCCSSSADVQVCADNAHITYFNGTQVASGTNWAVVEKFPVNVLLGDNIFAIKADDWAGSGSSNKHGVSATLNLTGCRSKKGIINGLSMNTDSIANWKCTENYYNGWNLGSYDDSKWPAAALVGNKGPNVSGNALPYYQIWASDETTPNPDAKTIYCRYSFSTLTANPTNCTPNCTGKCGGPDSCGGYCIDNCEYPETCGGSGIQYTCGQAFEFTCTPDCSNRCGGPDGCGGICENTCNGENEVCLRDGMTCKQLLIKPEESDGGMYMDSYR